MGKYITRGRTLSGRTVYRPGPGLGPAARSAVALGIKAYRAYTKTRTTGASSNQVGTSYQNDSRMIYRKKRMPRRKRRRWVRALRRNVALQMPQQATRTWLFNNQEVLNLIGTGLGTPQSWGYFQINSWNGLANERDIRRIVQSWPGGDISTQNRKFVIGAAVVDFTGNFVSTNPVLGLELDLYAIDAGRKTTSVFSNFGSEMSDIQNDISGNMILDTRGATPFQFPSFGGAHRLKVMFKKRWQLSPGQVITYQYRDPRNRYINADELENDAAVEGHFEQGWRGSGTKVFLLVAKVIGNKQAEDIVSFNYGVSRTYTTKALPATMQEGSASALTS